MAHTATDKQGNKVILIDGHWVPVVAPGRPTPPHTPTPTDPIRGGGLGAFLPASMTRQGNLQWDVPPVLRDVASALTLPGDVATGKQPVWGMDAQTGKLAYSPEVQPSVIAPSTRMGNLAVLASPTGDMYVPGQRTFETPDINKVAEAGSKGFQAARAVPVEYNPTNIAGWAADVQSELGKRGLPPQAIPDLHGFLSDVESMASANGGQFPTGITGDQIVTIRQSLQTFADKANAAAATAAKTGTSNLAATHEYMAAVDAIKSLDDFITQAADTGSGVISTPDTAAMFKQIYEDARGNVAASKRAGFLERKIAQAENRTSAANSGHNLGNTLRQRAADLLNNPERLRGWTKQEIAALKYIDHQGGNISANLLREVSNRLGGGGGGLNTALTVGGAVLGSTFSPTAAGIGAAIPPVIGGGTRTIYNNMVSNAMSRLEEMLLQRSPEAQKVVGTAMENPQGLVTLVRSLLLARQKDQKKPSTADQLYLDAKRMRDAQQAADEKMRQPGIY